MRVGGGNREGRGRLYGVMGLGVCCAVRTENWKLESWR